jgi:hypothetical protein
MFTLAAPGRLAELLEGAGFTEVTVETVELEARHESLDAYIQRITDLSLQFADVAKGLSAADRAALRDEVGALAAPFASGAGGALRLPARSLVATASA